MKKLIFANLIASLLMACAAPPAKRSSPSPPAKVSRPAWVDGPCWKHFGPDPAAVLCGVGSAQGEEALAEAELRAKAQIASLVRTSIVYLARETERRDGQVVLEQIERYSASMPMPRTRIEARHTTEDGSLHVLVVVDEEDPLGLLLRAPGLAATKRSQAIQALKKGYRL